MSTRRRIEVHAYNYPLSPLWPKPDQLIVTLSLESSVSCCVLCPQNTALASSTLTGKQRFAAGPSRPVGQGVGNAHITTLRPPAETHPGHSRNPAGYTIQIALGPTIVLSTLVAERERSTPVRTPVQDRSTPLHYS